MRRLLVPHLAVWLFGGALVRIAVIPPEHCPQVDETRIETAIAEGAGWLERGLGDDGRFVYGYDRDTDQINGSYNVTRHAGVLLVLYQVAAGGDDEALAAADGGLAFVTGRLLDRNDWTAFAPPGQRVSLGANSLLLAALAQRRTVTADHSHDMLMRRLGRFVVSQQQPNGAIAAWWDPATGEPVPGVYGQFATGEAFWALATLNHLFPSEGWAGPALAVAHYLATDRAEAEGYPVRLADHWAAYGLAEFDPADLDDVLAAYARRLAGYFALTIRVESQRTGRGINLLLRGYPGPGAGIGTAGEGLGALLRLARRDPRLADLRAGLGERLACMAGIMADAQVDTAEAGLFPRPDLARGAWFYRGYTQMDDQQHVVSALLASLAAVQR